MTPLSNTWQGRLVRIGRTRARVQLALVSVLGSVALTAVFFVIFDGTRESVAAFFVPAVLIPAIVAPLVVGFVIDAAVALGQAHRDVAERAAQLAAVLTTAPVGIAHVGLDHRVRSANALAQELLRTDAQAHVDWSSLFVNPDECEVLLETIAQGISLRNVRWGWNDRDGRTRLVRGHIAPIMSGSGERDGSVVIFEDITDFAALEAQVSRTQHLDLAGRLAGGMAHDFNNLLTIVLASTASLGRRAEVPRQELEAIEDAANRGARLTRRLLSISRRDVHTPVVEPVGSLLRETAELVRRAVKPGIRLEVEPRPSGATAAVDRDALQQAIINLVMNAQDAMGDHGTIRLSVEEHRDAKGGHWLSLGVHDDGPGMPAAVLARATEPFFSTKPSHLGTGLGLSIVSDTMQRHGGRLELASQPGRGTDATLWLPVVAPASASGAPSKPDAAVTVQSLELLLVEDEPALRDATERILRHLGHRVTSVEGVADALQWLEGGGAPDLIVSDIMMPDATGIDLLHTIRERGRETPVLLVSGFAVENIADELERHAQVAFLPKPWTISELQTSMRALLAEREQARGS